MKIDCWPIWTAAVLAIGLATAASAFELPPLEAPSVGPKGLESVSFDVLQGVEDTVQQQFQDLRALSAESLGSNDPKAWLAAYAGLGRLFHAYTFYQPAAVCYENALLLDPTRFELRYLLADAARELGDSQRADRLLNQALDSRPDYLPAWLGRFELALLDGRADVAESLLQQARQLAPGDPAVQFATGRLALERSQYGDSLEALEEALAAVPEASRLYYLMGQAARGLGNQDLARMYLSKAGPVGVAVDDPLMDEVESLRKGARVAALRGKLAYGFGQYSAAVDAYRQALQYEPDNTGYQVNLAAALAALQRPAAAIAQLAKALQSDPDHVNANYNLALLLAAQAPEQALEHAQMALSRAPDDIEIRYTVAGLQESLQRWHEAIANYDAIAERAPDSERALLRRAVLRVEVNEHARALELLERDWRRNPSYGQLTHLYARALVSVPLPDLRDPARAVPLARAVVEAEPSAERIQTLILALAGSGQCRAAALWQSKRRELVPEPHAVLQAEAVELDAMQRCQSVQ